MKIESSRQTYDGQTLLILELLSKPKTLKFLTYFFVPWNFSILNAQYSLNIQIFQFGQREPEIIGFTDCWGLQSLRQADGHQQDLKSIRSATHFCSSLLSLPIILLCCSAIVLQCCFATVLLYCAVVLCSAVLLWCSTVVLQWYCVAELLCCSAIVLQSCCAAVLMCCCCVWFA